VPSKQTNKHTHANPRPRRPNPLCDHFPSTEHNNAVHRCFSNGGSVRSGTPECWSRPSPRSESRMRVSCLTYWFASFVNCRNNTSQSRPVEFSTISAGSGRVTPRAVPWTIAQRTACTIHEHEHAPRTSPYARPMPGQVYQGGKHAVCRALARDPTRLHCLCLLDVFQRVHSSFFISVQGKQVQSRATRPKHLPAVQNLIPCSPFSLGCVGRDRSLRHFRVQM